MRWLKEPVPGPVFWTVVILLVIGAEPNWRHMFAISCIMWIFVFLIWWGIRDSDWVHKRGESDD